MGTKRTEDNKLLIELLNGETLGVQETFLESHSIQCGMIVVPKVLHKYNRNEFQEKRER